MSKDYVTNMIDRKEQRDTECSFLDMIERDIEISPGSVHPIPCSFLGRYEAIKMKLSAIHVKEFSL